ncbi:MAG: RNA polymerase sigma factor [Bacteroidota bacterium]
MISDWNNLSLARNGDQKAFSDIHKKYNKSLIKMTSLITGSLDSAKDIVQETFIRLLNSSIKHQEGNFKSYITTIAYRLALKEKSRSKRSGILNDNLIDNSLTPIEIQINEENQLKLFQAITSLPKDQRDILVLRFYGENSYETISKITQLPLGTVKSRIFYAVKACREKLKEMGVIE